MLFVASAYICLPIFGGPGFFHTVIGADKNSVLQGRQDQVVDQLILSNGDVLLSSKFNGNHGDVSCTGRSFANLTLLSSSGHIRWSKTYEQLPVDTLFARPHKNGFRLFVGHRYCHEENRKAEFEVWDVAANGELAARAMLASEFKLVDWSYADSELGVIIANREESKILFFRNNELVAKLSLPKLDFYDFSQTSKDWVILLRANVGRKLLFIDKATFKTRELLLDGNKYPEHWVTQIAANEHSEAVFLVRGPRYRHPLLQISEISDGEIFPVYRGVHTIGIGSATLRKNGELWIAGGNEGFAAYLVFRDGEIVDSKTFPSVLAASSLKNVSFKNDRVVLTGTSYLRGSFSSPDMDVFTVSLDLSSTSELAELQAWSACAIDIDRLQQIASKLQHKMLVYPNLRVDKTLKRKPERLYASDPVYPFEHGVPVVTPVCNAAQRMQLAISFYEELGNLTHNQDLNGFRGFKIYINYDVDKSVIKLEASNTAPIEFPAHANSAEEILDHIIDEIYPYLAQYLAAKRKLRSEAGILLEFQGVVPHTFSETAQLFGTLENDWESLGKLSQQKIYAAASYHTVYFVEKDKVSEQKKQANFSVVVTLQEYTRVIEKLLALLSQITKNNTVELEETFWALTGVQISMGSTNRSAYIDALNTMLSNVSLLTEIRDKLRGRIIEIVMRGEHDNLSKIEIEFSRLQLPIVMIGTLSQFTNSLGQMQKYYDPWTYSSPEQLMGLAIANNWKHQFERAIELGANFSDPCFSGQSPLHYATKNGRPEFVQRLLNLKVSVDLQNANGETALHLALEKRKLIAAEVLLEAGANPNLLNNNNETALDLALRRAHSLPKWLIEKIRAEGGKRGAGLKHASHYIPAHGCQPGNGTPQIILQ